MFQKNAEAAERIVKGKEQKIDDLLKQIDDLRKDQVEAEKKFLRKDNAATQFVTDQHDDKINSM